MGRWHAHAVVQAGHAVVAVVDPEAARAAELAARHSGAQPAPDLAAALASGRVEVVHVCAPLALHARLIEEALRAGCHVVAEKPLAPDAATTRALLALADERERLLVPVHQFLFQRGVLDALELLPAIGPILHLDAVACTAGAAQLDAAGRDRVAAEVLPHPLALARRFLGPRLGSADWYTRHPAPGELRADTVIGETTIAILVSTGGRPTTNQLRVIGARGTVQVDLFHGFATTLHGRATRVGKISQPFVASGATFMRAATNLVRRAMAREPAYPGLRTLISRFYAAAARRSAAPISAEETLDVALALERIMHGIRDGETAPRGELLDAGHRNTPVVGRS